MERADFQNALNQLRAEYAQHLPARISEIETVWHTLRAEWNAEEFTRFIRGAHSLAGSGATYGFPRVSQSARALERYAKQLEASVAPTPEHAAQIELLLGHLCASALDTPNDLDNESVEMEDAPTVEMSITEMSDAPLPRVVWVYEPDADLARDIQAQLGLFGYQTQVHCALPTPQELGENGLRALLLDWDAARSNFATAELDALQEKRQSNPALPFLFFATRDDLAARLDAVRHGATAYLVKPLVMTSLVETLEDQVGGRKDDAYRILIVEDDQTVAAYYANVLQQAGMLTQVVTNPLRAQSTLVEFRPDLILTDIYMPDMNGLELAAVLRQQEAYVSIPIVFLSSETDVEKQLSAMLLGGDDFLLKPIQAGHLVASVTSRVRRARVLRSLAERDSLTGLLNHTRFKELLAIQIARALRAQTQLAFVMLDIDRFKAVNDSYGHPTGDRVIKSLARLLQERLRGTDVLGRYGGEEFSLVLPGADGAAAWSVMEEIRAAFSEIRHQSGGKEFRVTFSAGVSTLPPCMDAATLSEAADRALYQAKRGGRNQVVYGME